MKNMKKIFAFLLTILLVSSCSSWVSNTTTDNVLNQSYDETKTLNIVSGSENKELEYILKRFWHKNGYNINMTYKGSLDIFQELNENPENIDAIWPASSVWENLLKNKDIKLSHWEYIFKTPVVFAIKKNKAQELGLIWKDVSIYDILNFINTWRLSFAMTNATQSNSWFSWFLSFLVWFTNKENNTITLEDLNDEDLLNKTRNLLKGVNRSSWSSDWLKDLFIQKYDSLDAMVNYESLIIDTNKELEKQWKEPLYILYMKEWLVFSNEPLSYVDKGNSEKEKIFLELQKYLMSSDVQTEIQNLWRRTWLSLNSNLDKTIYREDWWIKADLSKTKQIIFPSKETFEKMLDIYISSLKKPSLTVYVVDTSWSMEWNWISQLQEGLRTIFNQDVAKKYFLQAWPKDKSIIITFSNEINDVVEINWNSQSEIDKALTFINWLEAGWGTNMYLWLQKAFEEINSQKDLKWYMTSIILMSDWESDGEDMLPNIWNKDTSIFPISFWDSNDAQLKRVLDWKIWEFFDWKVDLIKAFKKAKWFN